MADSARIPRRIVPSVRRLVEFRVIRILGLIENSTLLPVLDLRRTRGCLHLWCGWRTNVHAMNAALISDECDRNQNEHYDEDDALFIFRQPENPKQAFHFLA